MIAMGLYYEGIRKCLINYTNDIIENINKIRHELYVMIAMELCYEGVRKCLINYTNMAMALLKIYLK